MTDQDTQVERRLIESMPGYAVGGDGSFWSCRIKGSSRRTRPEWKQIRPRRHTGGYLVVMVRPEPGGKMVCRYLHRLVLEAFVGPCPPGMQACHNNGNRTDNRAENLRWGTVAENHNDMRAHGTILQGEKNPQAKLVNRDIPIILRLLSSGVLPGIIARSFQVSEWTVDGILSGRRWRHIPR